MYLRKVHIENIRSIAELDWEIPEGQEAGWHVVIGDNGSGKTSVMRALSLALVGYSEALRLPQDWSNWLKHRESVGNIKLELIPDFKMDLLYEAKPTGLTIHRKKDNRSRVFLSYAREDLGKVKSIYRRLEELGFLPWMDVEDLVPGQRWEPAIRQALRESDFFLVFLSRNSVNKTGYIQREIKIALEMAEEKLESDIYLIPTLLEDCDVPAPLATFQWADISQPNGMEMLIKSIRGLSANRLVEHASAKVSSQRNWVTQLNFYREENEVQIKDGDTGFRFDRDLGEDKSGWFSVAYGPFRRFAGGDLENETIFSSSPRLAAHLSVFNESVALTECLKWLRELKFKQFEGKLEGDLLDHVIAFVNQRGFLPHQAQLKNVSSDGVVFVDGNGVQVLVEELSDGYRSVLSMTFELIRQMSRVYPVNKIFSVDSSKIIAPGVVLIDEIDAHLHPTWQRRIGLWFREHFPKIQFIVTTHSPLVCQAAEHGTVFRLPAPGSEAKAQMITGDDLNQLLYGDVLDAYGTQLFGEDVTRSDAGLEKLERLARLNQKGLRETLTAKERAEQVELRKVLSMSSHTLEVGR